MQKNQQEDKEQQQTVTMQNSTQRKKMGWTMGLEPTTAGITIRSSTN